MKASAVYVALALCALPTPILAQSGPTLPELPLNVSPPDQSSGEAGLWMTMGDVEQQEKISPLRSNDPALNSYINNIVCHLAGASCHDLRVYVIDDPYFNAEAAPNGMVLVNTGLLLRVDNEAQLAFVLGHEITHYLKRHVWSRFERVENTGNVLAFLSLGLAGASLKFGVNLSSVSDAAGLIAKGALLSYSRDQEREADAGGFELAVRNGYDPRQGAQLWANVDAEAEAEPDRELTLPYLSTHPTDKERLSTMLNFANEMSSDGSPTDLGADRLRAIVLPHRAEWLEEELNRDHPSQSIALINRLLKVDSSSSDLQYFLGEAYRRRNGDGDLESAVTAYQASIADPNANINAYRGLGIVALKSGNLSLAHDAFEKYIQLAPSAEDRAMIEMYLARTTSK